MERHQNTKESIKKNNGISTNNRIHFIVFISFEDLFGFFIFNLCWSKRIIFCFIGNGSSSAFYFFLDPFQKICKYFKKNKTRNVVTRAVISLFFVRYCLSFVPRIGGSIQCFPSIAYIL